MALAERRLRDAGLGIPVAQPSVANYVAALVRSDLLFVSGQLPLADGKVQYQGRVGTDPGIADGRPSAQLCALNVPCQVKAMVGDLDRVLRCIRIGGFVSCAVGLHQQSAGVSEASDRIVEALGEPGQHTRAAVGCRVLPLDAATEVEAVFLQLNRSRKPRRGFRVTVNCWEKERGLT